MSRRGSKTQPLAIYSCEKERHRNYITNFRVHRCHQNCVELDCPNIHRNQSPRRVPVLQPDGTWNYNPKICKNLENCKLGDKCRFAHSRSECSYHPLLYKVNDCKFASDAVGKCSKWGFDCSFAHEEEDRRVKGLQKLLFSRDTYKTVRCSNKTCSEQECCFFHDVLERRRPESEHFYKPVPCKFIYQNSVFLGSDLCPLKDDCDLAHSKNEIYYHKEVYMTLYCKSQPCYSIFCAFVHREKEDFKEELSEKSREDVENIVKEMIGIGLVVEEKSIESSEKEKKNEVPLKLRCKDCSVREFKWVLPCGAVICGKCLGKQCYFCGKIHATRIAL